MGISSRVDQTLTDISTASDAVAELTWPDHSATDRMGLENEAFPIVAPGGRPSHRLSLHGAGSVIGTVERASSPDGSIGPRSGSDLAYPTRAGGRLTFEPGGQIEHSSGPHMDTAALAGEIEETWTILEQRFHSEDVCLVSLGLDPWHDVDQVPQQQKASRYPAMAEYFSSAWPAGATMMRNTCSIQVNIEGGVGRSRQDRWLAANLMSPLLTAIFACSPGDRGEKSTRALTWQQIDPTRTGFPGWTCSTDADAIRDTTARALNANVMFVARDGIARALRPGWSFADWVREGHPSFGRPTIQDLETHLTTVFPEVRPRRGVLELRAIDALPRRWWMVPCVLSAALIFDDEALGVVIETLAHHGDDLPDLWRRAALAGLGDQQLRGAAEKLGRLALEAANRQDRFDPRALSDTEQFLERFTMRGRSPSDELFSLADDRDAVLEWACPGCPAGSRPGPRPESAKRPAHFDGRSCHN